MVVMSTRAGRVHGYSVVTFAVLASGCFAEVGGSFHPAFSRSSQDVTASAPEVYEKPSWSVDIKIGFYLGVPLQFIKSSVGVGIAPRATGGKVLAIDNREEAAVTLKGDAWRLDVGLPIPVSSYLWLAASGGKATVSQLHLPTTPQGMDQPIGEAKGSVWWLGPSISFRHPLLPFFFNQLSLGYERVSVETTELRSDIPTIRASASGLTAKFMFTFYPLTTVRLGSLGSMASSKPSPQGSCYYRDNCSSGICRSQWYCP